MRTRLLGLVFASLLLPVPLPAQGQERATLVHFAPIQSVAFSPDGKMLAAGSFYGGLKLWLVETGKELKSLGVDRGAEKDVNSVAFSPDGKILAWVSNQGNKEHAVRLYDVLADKALATLSGHTDQVMCVAFAPDGKSLASGSRDNTIRLWDVASGTEKASFKGHKNRVSALAFSPDGKTLASGGRDNTIRLWDVATGEVRATHQHKNGVSCVAFTRDGKTLVTGSLDNTIKLWQLDMPKELRTLQHVSSGSRNPIVDGLAIAPDGKLLASVTGNVRPGELRLWSLPNGDLLAIIAAHRHTAEAVAFSPDGKTLASGDADGKVKFWDVAKLLENKANKDKKPTK